jgi:hypothetical protein
MKLRHVFLADAATPLQTRRALRLELAGRSRAIASRLVVELE